MKRFVLLTLCKKRKALLFKKKKYQKIIELIMISIIETKLNNAFAISLVGYFTKNLNYSYIKIIKTIFIKYIKELKY